MRILLAIMLLALTSSGCANQQLRYSTIRQTSTLPDVQQRQVIENFARFASNSGELPFFAIADSGVASVTDTGSTGLAINAVRKAFPVWTISAASANRAISENWTLKPENNPDRLEAMRAAYLTVLNPSTVEPHDAELLKKVTDADSSYVLRQGWVCSGSRWDVPRNAWLVAHYGPTYAWVMPRHAAEFSRFVLLILKIETIKPDGASGGSATMAPKAGTYEMHSSPFAPGRYDQSTGLNSGLFFLPRPR